MENIRGVNAAATLAVEVRVKDEDKKIYIFLTLDWATYSVGTFTATAKAISWLFHFFVQFGNDLPAVRSIQTTAMTPKLSKKIETSLFLGRATPSQAFGVIMNDFVTLSTPPAANDSTSTALPSQLVSLPEWYVNEWRKEFDLDDAISAVILAWAPALTDL